MRIIICTKQIRHTYARTGKEPDKNHINPEDSIYRVNPYDEAAIEQALRLKMEQLSYQAGVWQGCLKRLNFNAVVPRIIFKKEK